MTRDYQETVTPTFVKDWPAAIAAGFEQINSYDGSHYSPTDNFLKGVARNFEVQESDWLYEQERLGTHVMLYDESRRDWRTVPVLEAAEIEKANEEHREYEANRPKRDAAAKEARKRRKWYRRLLGKR